MPATAGSTLTLTEPSWADSSTSSHRPRHAMTCNGARKQLGWAVQLGAVRFLGTFMEPKDLKG
ncbi:hypothetical protein FHX46_002947 [Amycolatopsis viridis]|uniref:Uncharacterized protein n=1 Tax=Amycolatopsis viridis TaxID=185678 RepID=A0ABX0STY3_9PSEU|nr:hypothetical protein [Amycolatopsis viridis]